MGNPLSYRDGMSFAWENGRSLKSISTGDNTVTMKYDSKGMRTQKDDKDYTTSYYYDSNNNLIGIKVYGTVLYFNYDSDGNATSFSHNGTKYYYVKNLQGDVVKIIDRLGNVVVTYTYDAWGKILNQTDSTVYNLAKINPFRYRGYVYDNETGLYYLQSRYYDPITGRFINADVYCDTQTGSPLSTNMFAYCENSFIIYFDYNGCKLVRIKNFAYYNTTKNIFYYSINAPQRNFGYCDFYDNAAGIFGMDIEWLTAYFFYDKKKWRIQFWKGTYGKFYGFDISTGAEIGVYYKNENSMLNFYKCASNSNTLKMSFTLF